MSGPSDNRGYYDAMSKGYERERHHGYHAFLDDSEVACIADLAAGRDVLEVGCGTGLILSRLAGIARRVVGADLSMGMLSRARGHAVVQADALALPFRDGAFDGAVAFKVLPHIVMIRSVIAEMARVVRPGGFLALEFYNRRSLRGVEKALKPPSAVAEGVADTDVFTRYDTVGEAIAFLPAGVRFERVHGIRVAIPAAFVADIPFAGRVILALDGWLSGTFLARLAGFIVVVARKEDR